MDNSWKYYQKAMLPGCKPHEDADLSVFRDSSIWRRDPWKNALFAKYTSDWDMSEETGWYWCIKDTPFDLSSVKAKYRYEIKRGIKNFTIKEIRPEQYVDELFDVTVDALMQYPKTYRAVPSKEEFCSSIKTWKKPTLAAFDNSGGGIGWIYSYGGA